MHVISLERSDLAQTAVTSLVTIGALTLLCWVLAYWTWSWLAPRPAPLAQQISTPVGGTASAQGLFGNVQRGPGSASPTGIAIKLLGVAAATGGRPGYAVVQLEARQILAVREGEDVAPGIRLAEVHADHIILLRNGIR